MEQKILAELQRVLDIVHERVDAGSRYAEWWWNYFCAIQTFSERITDNKYAVRNWKVVMHK